ncbi:MAG: glutamine--fructose-6-phosphate transaminase (isomerizing), partial [Alphaproteobacteria bacterium]
GNAHPHSDDRVAVVHNGIIENFQELRADLESKGHVFESGTDTEVVVHLISQYLGNGYAPEDAVHAALGRLAGAFSLA